MKRLYRSVVGRTLIAFASAPAAKRAIEQPRSALRPLALMALLTVVAIAASSPSIAGTGGTEFNSAYTTITNWLQGDLGRLIAASLLVVGLVMGVVRQSIMAAVPAIACGLVATVAPTIIGAVVTAVI